jgi:hypothetical protein
MGCSQIFIPHKKTFVSNILHEFEGKVVVHVELMLFDLCLIQV